MDPYGLSRGLPPLPHPTTSGLALPSTATAPPAPAKKRRSTWMGVPVDGQSGGEEVFTDVLDGGDESRKKRRKSRNGGSWAYVEVEEKGEGMEDLTDHGPGKRRGKIDYALLADSVGEAPVQEQPTARRHATRSRSTSARPSLPILETVQEDRDFDPSPPASFFPSSGWTLADDVELVQLAQSFKIDGKRVNWVAVAGRFGGGLRKNSQECEKRWRELEQEVEEALSGAPFEEEQVEADDDDGWSPALDGALLSAIDSLSSAPIAAYASLDTLLADPSDSNYAATAWETIAGSFEGKVKAASLALPGGVKGEIEPEALYARHQELLHPSPPATKDQRDPARHRSTSFSATFSRQLVEKVLALGGRPAFRDAGWEEGVERTARWVQVGVAVGGGRRVAEVVERWDEVRGEVKGKGRPSPAPTPQVHPRPSITALPPAPPAAVGESQPMQSPQTIKNVAPPDSNDHHFGPSAKRKRVWTTEEETQVERLVGEGETFAEIALRLGRTEVAVTRRYTDLCGVRRRAEKAARQRALVEEQESPYIRIDDAASELSPVLDDSHAAPSPASRLSSSEWPRMSRNGFRVWTAEEDDILLRRSKEGVSIGDIAKEIDRTEGAAVVRLGKVRKMRVEQEEVDRRDEGEDAQEEPANLLPDDWSDLAPIIGELSPRRSNSSRASSEPYEPSPPLPSAKDRTKVGRSTIGSEDDAKIEQWRGEGVGWTEIAKRLNRKTATVQNHWTKVKRKKGLALLQPGETWTPEQDSILRAGRAAGESFAHIAARLGRTRSAVSTYWKKKHLDWQAAGLLSPSAPTPSGPSLLNLVTPPTTTTAIPNLLPPSFGSFRAAQLASASASALAFTPYRDPAPSTASRPLLPPPPTARPIALSNKPTNLLPTSILPSHVKPASAKPPAPFRPSASSSSSSSFAPPAVQPVLSALPAPTRAPPSVPQQPVQYRPARLHPLLSRIRRVLEENEDGSDEDD